MLGIKETGEAPKPIGQHDGKCVNGRDAAWTRRRFDRLGALAIENSGTYADMNFVTQQKVGFASRNRSCAPKTAGSAAVKKPGVDSRRKSSLRGGKLDLIDQPAIGPAKEAVLRKGVLPDHLFDVIERSAHRQIAGAHRCCEVKERCERSRLILHELRVPALSRIVIRGAAGQQPGKGRTRLLQGGPQGVVKVKGRVVRQKHQALIIRMGDLFRSRDRVRMFADYMHRHEPTDIPTLTAPLPHSTPLNYRRKDRMPWRPRYRSDSGAGICSVGVSPAVAGASRPCPFMARIAMPRIVPRASCPCKVTPRMATPRSPLSCPHSKASPYASNHNPDVFSCLQTAVYVKGLPLAHEHSDSPTAETSKIRAKMDFVTAENVRKCAPQPSFCLSATAKRLAPKTCFLPVGNFIRKSSFCFLPVGNWIRFYLTFTTQVLYDVSVMKDVFTNRHERARIRQSGDQLIW